MDRAQFVDGDEIVDYWGYLKSVSIHIDDNRFVVKFN